MGAWGLGVFENDCAMDWLDESCESTGDAAIREALKEVVSGGDYLEVDEGSAGLAAIEILNCLRGNPPQDVPEYVASWVEANKNIETTDLVIVAKRALELIDSEESSEVSQLWLEAGHNWSGLVANIQERLDA